jgi:hypothetical protein
MLNEVRDYHDKIKLGAFERSPDGYGIKVQFSGVNGATCGIHS